jgi:uncharacterized protein (UPF0276 family)
MGFRKRHAIPDLGVGVGFRLPHYAHVLTAQPAMDWFEVISENFMVRGGMALANLARLLSHYKVIPHGVSLSVGGTDPLDEGYLRRLKALVDHINPPWFSDHLCWSGAGGVHVHDLLPLPMTRETVAHVAARVRQTQDVLERPFALENVSSYLTFTASTMPEWEFVSEVAERADCGVLLDCNNVYVSSKNHEFAGEEYIDAIDPGRVVQFHLAGHTDKGAYLLDTHSAHVNDATWALYRRALLRCGRTSTLIEWDDDIPSWDVLAAEAAKARAMRDAVVPLEHAGRAALRRTEASAAR